MIFEKGVLFGRFAFEYNARHNCLHRVGTLVIVLKIQSMRSKIFLDDFRKVGSNRPINMWVLS